MANVCITRPHRAVDLQKTDRPLPDRPTDNFCALFLLERGAYSLLTTDPHQQRRPGPRGTSRLVGDRSAPGQTPVGPKSLAGVLGDGRSRCRLPVRWPFARRSVRSLFLLWRAYRHMLCYSAPAHIHTQERAPPLAHSPLNVTPCAHARVNTETPETQTLTYTNRHTHTHTHTHASEHAQHHAYKNARARTYLRGETSHTCKGLFLT